MVERTSDVQLVGEDSNVEFKDLPLSETLIQGLKSAGFHYPSPIQLKALPLAIFGSDLIAQAKSGTGKTCVFSTTAIEYIQNTLKATENPSRRPKALIIAPTREIAVQIRDVTRELAQYVVPSIQCHAFIGGLAIGNDKHVLSQPCDIVVGTPGRIRALFDQQLLTGQSIRLLVFDEVDKLMKKDFESDLIPILQYLPERKQILAFSATFTSHVLNKVTKMMRFPQFVRTCGEHQAEIVTGNDLTNTTSEVWLQGVQQYYVVVHQDANNTCSSIQSKVVCLCKLLSEIAFQQCVIFCNDKPSALALSSALGTMGWTVACITGNQAQEQRLEAIRAFRECEVRVLISTDVTARGIDIEHVNLVINLDLPHDTATYLHRIGRSGRYGTHGTAFSLIESAEVETIDSLGQLFDMSIQEYTLADPTPLKKQYEHEERLFKTWCV